MASLQSQCDLVRTAVHNAVLYGLTREQFMKLATVAWDLLERPAQETFLGCPHVGCAIEGPHEHNHGGPEKSSVNREVRHD